MNIPCQNQFSECAPCSEFPFLNTSAEAPDSNPFIGIYWQPPQRGTWFAPGCLSICESLVSQQAADECAARQAIECSFDGAPDDGNPLPGGGSTAPRFENTFQSCDAECEGGAGTITALVAPGTVISATQADADARAHALACKNAQATRVCFATMSPLPSACQGVFASIPILAFGGTPPYTFTLDSGTLPTGILLDAVGLLSGTPTVIGTSAFTLLVTDSKGTSVAKLFSLTVADCSVPAPCPLFVDDNTSFGQQVCNTNVDPLYCASWTGLPPGSYKFVYIGGAFDLGGGFEINAFGTSTLKISPDSTANGLTVRFPIGNSDPSLAVVQAYYLTTNDSTNTEVNPVVVVIGDELKFQVGSIIDSNIGAMSIQRNAFATSIGSSTTFDVVRYKKPVAPQPTTLAIVDLATFANSRFIVTYAGTDSTPLALDANALTVQAALNAIPAIAADGGVLCAGTLDTGMTVTWVVNGARTALTSRIATVSPGWIAQPTVVQAGSGITPSIQTLLVDTICPPPAFVKDTVPVLPDYAGTILHRRLTEADTFWRTGSDPDPETTQMSGVVFMRALVRLRCGLTSPPFPAVNFWLLELYALDGNTADEEVIWNGYKTGGLDPTGTYLVFPNFYDDTGGCSNVTHGVQQIELSGTF
jgi:hypothetical protein